MWKAVKTAGGYITFFLPHAKIASEATKNSAEAYDKLRKKETTTPQATNNAWMSRESLIGGITLAGSLAATHFVSKNCSSSDSCSSSSDINCTIQRTVSTVANTSMATAGVAYLSKQIFAKPPPPSPPPQKKKCVIM